MGLILLIYTLFCFIPVLLVVTSAFTDEKTLSKNGFSLFPEKWSMVGMNAVLKYGKQLAISYGVTIGITIAGVVIGLFVMSLFAYAISRKDFEFRKFLNIYLIIPMLFSGGQLSCYIIYTSMYGNCVRYRRNTTKNTASRRRP